MQCYIIKRYITRDEKDVYKVILVGIDIMQLSIS